MLHTYKEESMEVGAIVGAPVLRSASKLLP